MMLFCADGDRALHAHHGMAGTQSGSQKHVGLISKCLACREAVTFHLGGSRRVILLCQGRSQGHIFRLHDCVEQGATSLLVLRSRLHEWAGKAIRKGAHVMITEVRWGNLQVTLRCPAPASSHHSSMSHRAYSLGQQQALRVFLEARSG